MAVDPVSLAETLQSAATQHGWETALLNPVGLWQRPWFRLTARTAAPHPRLYISAGIHGDEPAGPYAAVELLRQPELFRGIDVVIVPLLNPAGLAANMRGNAAGIDLNRDYRSIATEEVRGHIEVLRTLGTFDITVCLHEDWEAKGVYVYEVNQRDLPGCGRDVLAAMAAHLPIETSALIDGFEAAQGLISRNASHLVRPDWAEAIYLAHHHAQLGYTIETPSMAAPMEIRAATQVAGVRVIIDFLRRQTLPAAGGTLPTLAQ